MPHPQAFYALKLTVTYDAVTIAVPEYRNSQVAQVLKASWKLERFKESRCMPLSTSSPIRNGWKPRIL